ncbi:hypothetical protein [Desnuesiella massiliensis]|uniref:hypothetical protein n=1 Tax=Desnuesiella massiliensis TaxID=1650662 RepID=UPI0006E21245|nr:hypothetical protein [Desnuesiella massiliensis]
MRNKRIIIVMSLILLILLVRNCIDNGDTDVLVGNKRVNYLKVIDKVLKYDFSGMALVIYKVPDLYERDIENYYASAGNKEDNFSENTPDGNRLRSAKELFLNLKNLKVIKERITDISDSADKKYYLIQINLDYADRGRTDVYYLNLFINVEDYHAYIAKDYYEPNKLLNNSIIFVEYEPDQKTKDLIHKIINL